MMQSDTHTAHVQLTEPFDWLNVGHINPVAVAQHRAQLRRRLMTIKAMVEAELGMTLRYDR